VAAQLRVDTPCTYISASAATSARSERWVPFEQLGREPPGAVLRNPQLELANPRDQRPPVIARPVTLPLRCPLALLGAQCLGHLSFEHLLQRRPHQRPQELLVRPQKRFDVDRAGLTLPFGHGVHPP
jgi:hypothetical protein